MALEQICCKFRREHVKYQKLESFKKLELSYLVDKCDFYVPKQNII